MDQNWRGTSVELQAGLWNTSKRDTQQILYGKELCSSLILRNIDMVDSFKHVLLARHPSLQHIIEIVHSIIAKGKNRCPARDLYIVTASFNI